MGKILPLLKRDDELVRRILLDVQASPSPSPGRTIYIDAVGERKVNDHLILLQAHRLVECLVVRDGKGMVQQVLAKHLTAEGRNFLQAAGIDPVWRRAIAAKRATFAAFIEELSEQASDEAELGAAVPGPIRGR